jgi:small subunit ribosomal protein S6
VTEVKGTLLNRNHEIVDRKRHYETIYIINPQVNDVEAKEIADKNLAILQQYGAQSLRSDDWGKKRMAHPIDKHQLGRYHYFRIVSNANALKEFERNLKLDARVLRFQTVKLSEILSQAEIADLVEKAPREPSSAPSIRQDDEDIDSGFAS